MEDFISVEINEAIEADERSISAKLRSLRVRACIALDEFAEALGVETSELDAYENGLEDVPASVIALVCALSGVPYEYFFGDEDEDLKIQSSISNIHTSEEQPVLLS